MKDCRVHAHVHVDGHVERGDRQHVHRRLQYDDDDYYVDISLLVPWMNVSILALYTNPSLTMCAAVCVFVARRCSLHHSLPSDHVPLSCGMCYAMNAYAML